jgi:molecular chaperone GrpE
MQIKSDSNTHTNHRGKFTQNKNKRDCVNFEQITAETTINLMDNDIVNLSDKLKLVEKDLLLARAENENLRKRLLRQLEETHQLAISDFAKTIVNTLDDLYRATNDIKNKQYTKETFLTLSKGVKLTRSNFEQSLLKYGIKRLYPKGERFDYKSHEALSQIPTNDYQHETVLEVVQAGYYIKDKMLKHAQVIVSAPQEK